MDRIEDKRAFNEAIARELMEYEGFIDRMRMHEDGEEVQFKDGEEVKAEGEVTVVRQGDKITITGKVQRDISMGMIAGSSPTHQEIEERNTLQPRIVIHSNQNNRCYGIVYEMKEGDGFTQVIGALGRCPSGAISSDHRGGHNNFYNEENDGPYNDNDWSMNYYMSEVHSRDGHPRIPISSATQSTRVSLPSSYDSKERSGSLQAMEAVLYSESPRADKRRIDLVDDLRMMKELQAAVGVAPKGISVSELQAEAMRGKIESAQAMVSRTDININDDYDRYARVYYQKVLEELQAEMEAASKLPEDRETESTGNIVLTRESTVEDFDKVIAGEMEQYKEFIEKMKGYSDGEIVHLGGYKAVRIGDRITIDGVALSPQGRRAGIQLHTNPESAQYGVAYGEAFYTSRSSGHISVTASTRFYSSVDMIIDLYF